MDLPFSPQLFEMAMARIGIAMGQLKSIDTETKKAILRFFVQALHSGDANAYIKEALAFIDSREKPEATPEPSPAPAYRATSRPISDPQR